MEETAASEIFVYMQMFVIARTSFIRNYYNSLDSATFSSFSRFVENLDTIQDLMSIMIV